MTCVKSQEFLVNAGVTPKRTQDARKETVAGERVLDVLEGIQELYVVKGKCVTCIDLIKQRPSSETMRGYLLGPTGNLRAPAARVGHRLVVGFDPATYTYVLKG